MAERLRIDLRGGDVRKRMPRVLVSAGFLLLIAITTWISPTAYTALALGLRWLFAFVWIGAAVLVWREPGRMGGLPARLVFMVVGALLVGLAAMKTFEAIG